MIKDKTQKEIFVKSEGTNFYRRNKKNHDIYRKTTDKYKILNCMDILNLKPERVLEIGCSDGWRLKNLKKKYNAKCFGLDPSFIAL